METILERNQVNIEDEMRRSYLDYAMSVIVGRALPDVRDGLKLFFSSSTARNQQLIISEIYLE